MTIETSDMVGMLRCVTEEMKQLYKTDSNGEEHPLIVKPKTLRRWNLSTPRDYDETSVDNVIVIPYADRRRLKIEYEGDRERHEQEQYRLAKVEQTREEYQQARNSAAWELHFFVRTYNSRMEAKEIVTPGTFVTLHDQNLLLFDTEEKTYFPARATVNCEVYDYTITLVHETYHDGESMVEVPTNEIDVKGHFSGDSLPKGLMVMEEPLFPSAYSHVHNFKPVGVKNEDGLYCHDSDLSDPYVDCHVLVTMRLKMWLPRGYSEMYKNSEGRARYVIARKNCRPGGYIHIVTEKPFELKSESAKGVTKMRKINEYLLTLQIRLDRQHVVKRSTMEARSKHFDQITALENTIIPGVRYKAHPGNFQPRNPVAEEVYERRKLRPIEILRKLASRGTEAE